MVVDVREVPGEELVERLDAACDHFVEQLRLKRRHPQPPQLLVDGLHRGAGLARLDQPREDPPLHPVPPRPVVHGLVERAFVEQRPRLNGRRVVQRRIR